MKAPRWLLDGFPCPAHVPSWHVGHMASAMKSMRCAMPSVDLVVEVRDARLPLTSINPHFESLLRATTTAHPVPRLVVYNKRDLANEHLEQHLVVAFEAHDQDVMFTQVSNDKDMKQLLKRITNRVSHLSHDSPSKTPQRPHSKPFTSHQTISNGIRLLICGMPNVGKSSLLNGLRRVGLQKGKAAREAPMPGFTRSIDGFIRVANIPHPLKEALESLPVYVIDTPGIMIPYIGSDTTASETALKWGISAQMKESCFELEDLIAYLLYRLLLQHYTSNSSDCPKLQLPTPDEDVTDIHSYTRRVLSQLAKRRGSLLKGGDFDLQLVSTFLLKSFRQGHLGRLTLDTVLHTTSPQLPFRYVARRSKTWRQQVNESVTKCLQQHVTHKPISKTKLKLLNRQSK